MGSFIYFFQGETWPNRAEQNHYLIAGCLRRCSRYRSAILSIQSSGRFVPDASFVVAAQIERRRLSLDALYKGRAVQCAAPELPLVLFGYIEVGVNRARQVLIGRDFHDLADHHLLKW